VAGSGCAAVNLSQSSSPLFLLVTVGKRIGFSTIFRFPNWIFQLMFVSGGVTFLKTKAVSVSFMPGSFF